MKQPEFQALMSLDRAYNQLNQMANLTGDPEYDRLAQEVVAMARRLRILSITAPAEAMPEQSQPASSRSGDTLS